MGRLAHGAGGAADWVGVISASQAADVVDEAPPRPNVEEFLNGVRSAPVVAKRDWILDACRGRRVLDVGCVQHSWEMALENPRWLHKAIVEEASSCVGVDYLADDVAELVSRGYSMVAGDVLVDDPPGVFERVVLGDIIEHVEHPARLLEYAAAALSDDGLVLISTPNPFYIGQFITIAGRRRPTVNPEHVAWYDPTTLAALVDRSPLEVVEMRWLAPSFPALWNSRRRLVRRVVSPALNGAASALRGRRPFLNSDFGVVLRCRRSGGESVGPERGRERAAEVMAFHRGTPRGA